jgi:hypothetical protein
MSTTAEISPLLSAGVEELHWSSRPLHRRPKDAIAVTLALFVTGATVFAVTGSRDLTVLSLLSMGLAGWRVFVPIEFTLDGGGVMQRCLRQQQYDDWTSFRAFSPLTHGFVLWPSERPCAIDATRGLYLPAVTNREQLLAMLRQHLAEIG